MRFVNFKRTSRPLLFMLGMTPVLSAIYFLSYWLRFEGQFEYSHYRSFAMTLPWVVAIKLVVFVWFRIHQSWSRFITFHDILLLGQTVTCSWLITAVIDYLFMTDLAIPRSIFLMDWGATIVGLGGFRALRRTVQERRGLVRFDADRTPTFIVGVNDSGEALLRAIKRNHNLKYHVAGFIDQDVRNVGTRIGGVPVLGVVDQTCELAQRHNVRHVLLTSGDLSGRVVRQLVEQTRALNIQVNVLPSYEQLLHGHVAIKPRPVAIGDLLRRDPVQLDMGSIRDWIDNRVLLVTGSAGSIGSEICRQLAHFSPKKIILLDRSETGQFFLEHELRELYPECELEVCMADINDATRLNSLFKTHQPEIVFHAAAYKHVPMMEAHVGEALKNISLATRLVADLAKQHQVQSFVMISTDKAVNPTSVMDASKRLAEMYVQALADDSDCRFVTVRFGNVLDSAGSVVPIFRQQIAAGGPVTVTDPEMTRYFMTIPEASQLVIQAGAMGRGGEIFVLDMGEPVRISDLAADMIRLSGLEVGRDIEIRYVGLRPGEKLFEELHIDGERHLATSHPKIMIAESQRENFLTIVHAMNQITERTEAPRDELLRLLASIVTEYQIPATAPAPDTIRAAA
ncbi:MAG TPA: nucleoside-diphosphate sugar epimerase/dehydratase [Pirellulales bacterium]|nr:nucleoside-diphosphate sugar epimerase/dehydratase [Pirellulales bacterium]